MRPSASDARGALGLARLTRGGSLTSGSSPIRPVRRAFAQRNSAAFAAAAIARIRITIGTAMMPRPVALASNQFPSFTDTESRAEVVRGFGVRKKAYLGRRGGGG